MEEDKRVVHPDGKAVERFRRRKLWSQQKLADEAQVDLDTIKRTERDQDKTLGTMKKIAEALGVEPTKIVRDFHAEPAAAEPYTWDDLITGAKNVGGKIFEDEKLLVDAVLTFPGPSSLFCGLVLALLPLEIFVRTPVYTAIFVDKNTPTSKRLQCFHVIPMPRCKILVPRELTDDRSKKIVVIEDATITGGTMKALRKFFAKNYNPANVQFACCICYEGRTLPTEQPPEIRGLDSLEQRRTFPMPWGPNSQCNEDAFRTHEPSVEKSRLINQ